MNPNAVFTVKRGNRDYHLFVPYGGDMRTFAVVLYQSLMHLPEFPTGFIEKFIIKSPMSKLIDSANSAPRPVMFRYAISGDTIDPQIEAKAIVSPNQSSEFSGCLYEFLNLYASSYPDFYPFRKIEAGEQYFWVNFPLSKVAAKQLLLPSSLGQPMTEENKALLEVLLSEFPLAASDL